MRYVSGSELLFVESLWTVGELEGFFAGGEARQNGYQVVVSPKLTAPEAFYIVRPLGKQRKGYRSLAL